MLTALSGYSTKNLPSLFRVNYNRAPANRLIETVVIDYDLTTVFFPDFDSECVRGAISGPEHEFVVACTVDGARTLELGVRAVLIHNQPIITAAVEIQVSRLKHELGLAGRHSRTFLVL